MNKDFQDDAFVLSAPVVEFVTVAAETCLFLEHAGEYGRKDFVSKGLKILSLLYLKASIVEKTEKIYEDGTERFVTEDEYNEMKDEIAALLGEPDSYLETFHPDMSLSDTPVAAFISENLADIYQELKDFATNYQLADAEIMQDALVTCIEGFEEHWGQKTLNALRALHAYRYSDQFADDEENDQTSKGGNIYKDHVDEDSAVDMPKINRNSFMNFLRDEEEEDEINRLI